MDYRTQKGIAPVFLHTHTDMGSPKDAVLTINKYLETCKAYGAKAAAITDHGTMYAIPFAYEKFTDAGIKLLIGVEFYVCDDVEIKKKKYVRLHLCAYAKDMTGYHVLCRLVTESNKRIISMGKNLDYPCISKKLLTRYIGEGSEGHGHVILTSACIGGVVAGITFVNNENLKELEDIRSLSSNFQMYLDGYDNACKRVDSLTKKVASLSEIASKKYGKRESVLKKHPDEVLEAELKKEKEETEKAQEMLKTLKPQLKASETSKKNIEKQIAADCKFGDFSYEGFLSYIEKTKKKEEKLIKNTFSSEELEKAFEEEMKWYQNLAGPGCWLIEMQNHGIPEEKKYMYTLAKLADKLGIPIVAANDAHMQKKEDCMARKYINALRFNKWQDPQAGDDELYLKDDSELFTALASVITEKYAIKAMNNREIVAQLCNVELKKEPHYPVFRSA